MANLIQSTEEARSALKHRRKILEETKDIEKEIILWAVENKIPGLRVDWNILEANIDGRPRRFKDVPERY